jgi:predicted nucleic acid-binding protein
LVLIGAIDVLPAIFSEIYAPPSVIDELTHEKAPNIVRQWASSSPEWLKVVSPTRRLPSTARLGPGEADAISLAKELQIVEILIDERRGRNLAVREGLIALPTLAVLERAAADDLLDLTTVLGKLVQTNMRVPLDQLQAALIRDAARKRR